ncbi:universal stress protein [Curtobacterium flaccumfaciens]|jgi:nucleotide-binding universal stress UspA family protein|uniref:universal stress protein n=1 Tax=Curtobacterium flaccumfaciens TaxID=2035 RepID=UPI001BDEEA06|nr:universal stress protein [Curtobacterium flaccumfaciens]MBT1631664.1 universal stress protein [Curtobacterium flaccumfaciens pv. oortii]MCX2844177.1 universal stress protein [Curtobacterium flaccumfaciens pv. oortii]
MSASSAAKTIVVGILPNQTGAVIEVAAGLAQSLHATLICVSVDPARYVVQSKPDGPDVTATFDPDAVGLPEPHFDRILADQIQRITDPLEVECDFQMRVDDPARTLSDVAEENDALMIVIGTRKPTAGGALREFFSGSVAARLTHQQHRPVLVVPVEPTGFDAALPWESA